ncbi:MAG: hypothetical protein DME21_02530 [Verrucomicrobia bacterium]|nr:MAG: hypothetical protein DME21_02530 [Verrucomicrobiota bacterium]
MPTRYGLLPPSFRDGLEEDEGAGCGRDTAVVGEYDRGGLLGWKAGASIARGAATGGGEKFRGG